MLFKIGSPAFWNHERANYEAHEVPTVPDAVELSMYNPDAHLRPGYSVLVVGKRGTGKTHLMVDFLYAMRNKLQNCTLFCPTSAIQEYNAHFASGVVIENNMNTATVNDLCDRVNGKSIGIITDDMCYERHELASFKRLMEIGRHSGFFMYGAQTIMDVPKKARGKFDLYVFFPTHSTVEMELNFRQAGGEAAVGDFTTFKLCMKSLQSQEALVINMRAQEMGEPSALVYKKRSKEEIGRFDVGLGLESEPKPDTESV